jgi:hypothetical protein
VEHQGSQIRARFRQKWPEEGDPAAAAVAAVRGTRQVLRLYKVCVAVAVFLFMC